MASNDCFNYIFLIIFIIEIIFGIIGIFKLPMRIELLTVAITVVFLSGAYTVKIFRYFILT